MRSVFTAMSIAATTKASSLAPVGSGSNGWWPFIKEPFTGAWQRNVEWSLDTVLAYHAVYACVTRIANDIGNMPTRLMEVDDQGIWREVSVAAFSPVLRRPNRYQNHIQFKQWWITSKLVHGNMYALKQRDKRGAVTAEYILNPCGAKVLVSPDGSVFYQFQTDNLTGIEDPEVAFPASEIIHDRMNCLFHPLVGIAPLYACGLTAAGGLKMQADASLFFANGANPGGVLTAPGAISDETAKRLQEKWTANYTGENAGKVAVMGDGLKYEPMRMSYADAQLIEQLRMNAEIVCSVYGMPPFKIGMGSLPAGMKVSDMEMLYYNNALHTPIEEMELCQDDALGLDGVTRRIELDLDTLLRMDPTSMADMQVKLVGGAIAKPNEARRKFNLEPIDGGDTVYLQQQNYSLAALDARDQTNPLAVVPPAVPAPAAPQPQDDSEEETRALIAHIHKGLMNA